MVILHYWYESCGTGKYNVGIEHRAQTLPQTCRVLQTTADSGTEIGLSNSNILR